MPEVTLASLAMDFDVKSADPAIQKTDALRVSSRDLELQARKTEAAQRDAAIAQGLAGTAAGQAQASMRSLAQVYGQARDSLGRFTDVDGSFRHSQEATALMAIRNAQAQAALAREQAKAEAQVASLTKKFDSLRAELDPLAAIQVTLAQRTNLLDTALAKGAITADQHAAMLSKVTRAALADVDQIDRLQKAHLGAAGSAKLQTYQLLNLGRQFSDVGVSLASGQAIWMVAIQQGAQIGEVFTEAKTQGVSFKAAIRGLVAEAGPLIATFGPWVAGLAAVGGAAWYVVDAYKKQSQAIKDLNKDLKEQHDELSKISPFLFTTGQNADLAAEGQRNFDHWLRTANISLAEQNRLLRENALNDLNAKAIAASENLRKAQEQFDKASQRGATIATAGAYGGFSVVAPVQSKDPTNNPFYKEAAANLKAAKEAVNAIAAYQAKMGQAPDTAFAAGTGRAARAVREVVKATEDYIRAAPIEESQLLKAANVVWPEAAAAAEAYKKQQDALRTATNDNIKTFDQATAGQVRFSSRLEIAAADMEAAARVSRELRFDIEDIGRAIEAHDWATGFAGLLHVLEQVKTAFAQGATAAEKFAAISGVGQGIGSLIGGKTGAAISGAASGAQAGFTLGGPWGAVAGAALGGLSGIIGSSAAKAEKKVAELTKAVEDLRTDNKTSSGSIAAALAEANKNWNSDLEYSSAMLSALRSIDAKTGAVASLVARQVSTGGLLSTKGLGLGSTTAQGSLGAGLVAGGLTGATLAGAGSFLLSGLAGSLALGPIGLVAGAVGALVGALTKTKTTTEILDQGLQFTASTFDQITKNGVTGSSYADLLTTTKKSILGVGYSTKVKTSTVTGSIDPDLLGQISGVIQALGDGVLSAAAVFGEQAAKSAEAALGSAVVDLGKLSLKDLKPDEIASVLQATFDKVGDQLAAAGVPGLDKLAAVGEGAFETLTRLAREYQVVDVALTSIGKTFGEFGLASIAARDNLVQLLGGVDEFASKTSFFAQHFLSDAEQLAPVIKAVNDNLAQYGLSAQSSRDQFKSLVLAQNLTTESGRATYAALLAIAPAFDKVASAAEASAKTIADAAAKLVTDAEQAAASARSALQSAYDAEKARLQGVVDAAAAAEAGLRSAYESQSSSIQATIDRLNSFSDSIKAFSRSLDTGDLSGASAAQRYASTRAEFERVRALALAGDQTAQGQFQGAAQDFLKASADNSGTALGYLSDLGAVKDATDQLGKTADTQAGLAEQQLAQLKSQVGALIDLQGDVKSVDQAIKDLLGAKQAAAIAQDQMKALDQQVAGLLEVNTSVLSVKDAILGLNAAIKALADAQAVQKNGMGWTSPNGGTAVPTNPNYGNPYGSDGALLGVGGLLGKNASGQPTFDGFTAAELAWVNSPLELGGERTAAAQAIQQLKAMYGPNVLPGFDKGGSFMIGGFGGIDQNLLSINGMPAARVGQGEIVTITPPAGAANDDGRAGLLAEIRALRNEVAQLRQDARIIGAAQVKATHQPQWAQDWDVDGLPPERVA